MIAQVETKGKDIAPYRTSSHDGALVCNLAVEHLSLLVLDVPEYAKICLN